MGMILTEHEREIYPFIQNYLSTNKMLEIDRLISYLRIIVANKDVNLNYVGIKQTVQNLIEKKIILEGTRLTKEQILNNGNRKDVFTFICSNPGVYHFQIAKHLNLANHIVNWHLDALLNFDFIKEVKIDNHQIYYDSNISPDHAIIQYYFRSEKVNQILSYLRNKPEGVSKTKIAKDMNMHPLTVKKYVDDLLKYNLLIKKNSGPKVFSNEIVPNYYL